MAQETTGNTQTQINRPHPTYLSPEHWMDETYDEEMDMFYFDIVSYSGDEYRIGLRSRDIDRMNLFRAKEGANHKYWKHITKYY